MNASSGTAIAVSDNTPSIAGPIKLPISANGINNKVNTPANIVKASTLDMALSTLLIRAKTPTNANNGTASNVKATMPFRELPILPLIVLRILSTTAMASISTASDPAELMADTGSTS